MLRTSVLTLLLSALAVNADFCSKGSAPINGNYYCQPVKHIKYKGVGHSGSYNAITGMADNGQCSSSPRTFSGDLAPFNEDLSIHARGPLNMKQIAVYVKGQASKRDVGGHKHRRHNHRRAMGDMVVATIDGKVVSWANNYGGSNPPSATPHAENVAPAPAPVPKKNQVQAPPVPSPSGGSSGSNKPSVPPTSSKGGAWGRAAYFNMDSGTADGLVFMNNMGGRESGVFDYVYGNSLAYAAASKDDGAKAPEVLKQMLKSNQEVAIFSDRKCDDGCGFFRPGTPAHYGWEGDAKIFVFEFNMPDDGTSGWNMNMPAIWLLNGRIPRTGQYATKDCSCWESGCGELDLIEVLDSGNTRCKSTIHNQKAGGCSDYFVRPTSGTMKLAAVLYNNEVNIKVLDNFDFGSGLSEETVNSWIAETDGTSVFNM